VGCTACLLLGALGVLPQPLALGCHAAILQAGHLVPSHTTGGQQHADRNACRRLAGACVLHLHLPYCSELWQFWAGQRVCPISALRTNTSNRAQLYAHGLTLTAPASSSNSLSTHSQGRSWLPRRGDVLAANHFVSARPSAGSALRKLIVMFTSSS